MRSFTFPCWGGEGPDKGVGAGCILLLKAIVIAPPSKARRGGEYLGAAGGEREEQGRWGWGRLLSFLSFLRPCGACDPMVPVTPHYCCLRDLPIWGLGKFSFRKNLTLGFLLSETPRRLSRLSACLWLRSIKSHIRLLPSGEPASSPAWALWQMNK